MAVSYKKLWHILLDRDLKKKNFQELAGLTGYAMNRLSRDDKCLKENDFSEEDIAVLNEEDSETVEYIQKNVGYFIT